MDWGFTGLLDVLIVVGALISILLGFKKGFMNKMLSLVGVVAILIFAFFFCTQVASWFYKGPIYNNICENFTNNINGGLGITPETTTADVISAATGLPTWITQFMSNAMGNPTPQEAVNTVAETLTGWVMNAIAFVGIFVIGLIVLLILKIITRTLRSVTVVKVIDGVLGIVLYVGIYFALLTAFFALLNLVLSQDWPWMAGAKDWFVTDMKLLDDNAFRISKILYNSNIFVKFFSAIFGWK